MNQAGQAGEMGNGYNQQQNYLPAGNVANDSPGHGQPNFLAAANPDIVAVQSGTASGDAAGIASGDRVYQSQIYGQPGTGVHPSYQEQAGQNQPVGIQPPDKPIPVTTIPPEQQPKQLNLDPQLFGWLVGMTRKFPDYHAWTEEVCKDDRVTANNDLVTSILMSESLFRNLQQQPDQPG